MNYFFVIVLGTIFSFGSPLWAAELSVQNAGLVPANIWYSKDPFFAGDKVRIYTVIFNGSIYDLSGTMEFLDNGTLIGTANFSVSHGGSVREVWVDWQATLGSHAVTAHITEVHRVGADGKKLPIEVENAETGKSTRSVDLAPQVKAAQAAEEAKKSEAVRQAVIGKAEQAAKTVDEVTLPARESVASGASVLDQFRADTAEGLAQAVSQKEQDIKMIKAREATATSTSKNDMQGVTEKMRDVAEKPFAYVLLAVYTVLEYLFKWQVIFYGIILYASYRLLKWVVRRVRGR